MRGGKNRVANPPAGFSFAVLEADEKVTKVEIRMGRESRKEITGVLEVPTDLWNELRERANVRLGHKPDHRVLEQAKLISGMLRDRHAMDPFDWELLGVYAGELLFLMLQVRETAARRIRER